MNLGGFQRKERARLLQVVMKSSVRSRTARGDRKLEWRRAWLLRMLNQHSTWLSQLAWVGVNAGGRWDGARARGRAWAYAC